MVPSKSSSRVKGRLWQSQALGTSGPLEGIQTCEVGPRRFSILCLGCPLYVEELLDYRIYVYGWCHWYH